MKVRTAGDANAGNCSDGDCQVCRDTRSANTILKGRVEELEEELRQEWWWNHGDCDKMRYGDDGEMQCHGVDFKRTELDQLRVDVKRCRLERARRALEKGD